LAGKLKIFKQLTALTAAIEKNILKKWRMRILGAVFFRSLLAGKSKIFKQILTRIFLKKLAHAYFKRQ